MLACRPGSLVLSLGLVLFASAPFVGTACAQDAAADELSPQEREARESFETGRVAFEAGRFQEALEAFEHAFELSDRAALLYNIGASHDRLSHEEEALTAYRTFLEREPDTERRAAVEARIEALQAELDREAERERTLAERERTLSETERALEEERARPDEGNEIWEEWWFWTIIGVAVVGGAVGLGVGFGVARRSIQDPLPGDDGLVVQTLEGIRF